MRTTDSLGRTIGWRRLSALEDFDLTEIAGSTNSQNFDWMLRATIAFGTREIDGDPIPRPATKDQLRAIVARLEQEGFEAVMRMFQESDQSPTDQGGVERAKNSQGTPESGNG